MHSVAMLINNIIPWRSDDGGETGSGSDSKSSSSSSTGSSACSYVAGVSGAATALTWSGSSRRAGGGGQSGVTAPPAGGKLAEQVVLIVGVFLLQLTCGQQQTAPGGGVGGSKYQQAGSDVSLTQEDMRNLQEDQLTPYRVAKAVSIQDFSEVLKSASSYHDVLRVFYGSVLTNEAIDNMMASHPQPKFYGSAFGRPRIGGLSDSMSFAMAPPNLQGIPSLMRDDAALLRSAHSIPRGRRRHRHGKAGDKNGRKQRRRERRKGRRKQKKDHDAALEHYKEMEAKAHCRLPVPVVLRIRDISNAASKIYFPECTIVHRCRADSGCCNETSTCASSANSTVQRSFFALEYIKDGDKVRPGKQIVETLTFINHTECACAPIQQIPECRECPYPFYLRRENKTDCTCDCFYRDHTCIHIKKGKSPLHEHQLSLIKEGKRLRPKCQYGVFGEESIRTGYCPARKVKQSRQPAAGVTVSGYGAGDSAKRRGNWG